MLVLHLWPKDFPNPAYCGTRNGSYGVKTSAEFWEREGKEGWALCKRCRTVLVAREAAEVANPTKPWL